MKWIILILSFGISTQCYTQSYWSKNYAIFKNTNNFAFYFGNKSEILLGGFAENPAGENYMYALKVNPLTGDSITINTCLRDKNCDDRITINHFARNSSGELFAFGDMTFSPCPYFAQIDENLKINWVKYLCDEDLIHFISGVIELEDAIIFVGNYSSSEVVIQKRSFQGERIWDRRIKTNNIIPSSPKIVKLENGFFLIYYAELTVTSQVRNFLEMYDINGNQIWEKEINWPTHDIAVFGNKQVLSIESESILSSFYSNRIKKLDAKTGSLIWERNINILNVAPQSIVTDGLGNIFISGTSKKVIDAQTNKYSFSLTKLDSSGTFIWNRIYESDQNEYPRKMFLTADNGLCIQGYRLTNYGRIEIALKKVNSDGLLKPIKDSETTEIEIKLSPNPSSNTLDVKIDNYIENIVDFRIFASNGKLVLQNSFLGNSTQLNISTLPMGFYVFQLITTNGRVKSCKFIKL